MTVFPIGARGSADLTGLISSFASASSSLSTFSTVAGTATLAGAALATVGISPLIDRASQFQSEMVRLNTLADVSISKMRELQAAVLDLAPGLGTAPDEMVRGLYAIASGGERSDRVLELLVQSSKAARLGLGEIADIAKVGTAALQAFTHQGLTATEAIDIMLATVREGAAEAEDLPVALGRVIGIAGQMGVTFGEVGTFMATFTRLGVSAEIAATSLRSTLFALLNPGQEAKDTFRSIGLSVDEMRTAIAERGLTQAMLMLLEATNGNLEVLGNIIPNIRAMSGVLGVYAAQADAVVDIQEKLNNAVGITDEAFISIQDTYENTISRFKAEVESLATSLGTYFLPAATSVVSALNRMLSVMADIGVFTFDFSTDELTKLKEALGFGDDENNIENIIKQMTPRLEELSTEELTRSRDLSRQRQLEIGQQQKDKVMDPTLVHRMNLQIALEKKLNEVLETRIVRTTPAQIQGLRVVVGATDDQREATEKLIATLEERLLREQDNERQIILNKLAANEATKADTARALAIFDTIKALEAAKEAEKELQRQREENERTMDRLMRASRNRFVRGRADANEELIRERERDAQLIVEIEAQRIADSLDRQARLVQDVADSFTRSFQQIITGTKDVADAFGDMINRIIFEFAKLKVEQAIVGLLNNILIPVPSAPGAIPVPTIDPTAGLNALPPIASGIDLIDPNSSIRSGLSPTVIVEQTLSFPVSAIDTRTGAAFIREQSGEIARIVGEAAQNSVSYTRQLRGI